MEPPKLAQKVQHDRKILDATCADAL
jgi:myosin-1